MLYKYNMKVLVLGASEKLFRYSNRAVRMLCSYGHDVVAVGRRMGNIGDIPILDRVDSCVYFHTVTLYLNPSHQLLYYDYLLKSRPHRIIFNPGTENEELKSLAVNAKIEVVEACTLVMLATNSFYEA